jgi:DDE family transposase
MLDGRDLSEVVQQAAALLATVVGQDLEQTADGTFRIARKVAKDRVISTVDTEARHGHKTSANGFDGYKGHIAIDPDSEMITAAAVTAANVGDGSVAKVLLKDVVPLTPEATAKDAVESAVVEVPAAPTSGTVSANEPVEVYGDASYGSAEVLKHLEDAGVVANVKVQSAPAPGEGMFSQDAFNIDTVAGTARCPQGVIVQLRHNKNDGWFANFGGGCEACPLRSKCTVSETGRTLNIHPEHERIRKAREHQRDADWKRNYRATRPKVERKLAHLMRHRHGGRRARMRGRERVAQDFMMRCAVVNLKRLAVLDLRSVNPTSAARAA